jgi:3'-5' exoribonuclease
VPDFPPKLRTLLLHLILSHHGEMEFGSPKVPQFAEALLLHHLDNLDSKMECARAAVENDRLIEGEWTGYISPLDRSLLKKQRFLEPPPPATQAARANDSRPPEPKPAVPPKRPEPEPSPFAAKLGNALRSDS